MSRIFRVLCATLLAGAAAGAAHADAIKVDPQLPSYVKESGVAGNLNSVGSDTMNNLLTLWAEGFRRQYPNVRAQVDGKGSGTAPPALISGTAQLGPMSRPMKATEIDEFEKKFGYKPTAIAVAIDGLAVYVHKDNPLTQLSLTQVDAIFSKGRACGFGRNIVKWGDLGLTGAWADKPISIYGRNSASGTYGYFKEHALCKGDFKDTVKEQPGSAAVVQGITTDMYGIGYSGIGYRTSGVRALALARKEGEPFISDEASNVLTGRYPLARFLYIYVNRAPGKPLDPLVREFVRYALSSEGQEVVLKDGYLPITAAMAEKELAKLQ